MPRTRSNPQVAPVEETTPRPYEPRSDEETRALEGEHVDQIANYHEENPTLDATGPAFDEAKRAKALEDEPDHGDDVPKIED